MVTTLIILVIAGVVLLLGYASVPQRAEPASGAGEPGSHLAAAPDPGWFTLGTYNIHGAKGRDGVRDLARTAGVIGTTRIVALQEVRAGWLGNQVRELGDAVDLGGIFAPALRRWFRDYRGNGLLSAYPIRKWQTFTLPNVAGRRYRIYTVAEIALGRKVLSVLFTHLHTRAGRKQQMETVLRCFASLPQPCVLIGDLNSGRDDPAFGSLPDDAVDALARVLSPDDGSRVDWIITRGLEIRNGGRVNADASDHPYYWTEVRLT